MCRKICAVRLRGSCTRWQVILRHPGARVAPDGSLFGALLFLSALSVNIQSHRFHGREVADVDCKSYLGYFWIVQVWSTPHSSPFLQVKNDLDMLRGAVAFVLAGCASRAGLSTEALTTNKRQFLSARMTTRGLPNERRKRGTTTTQRKENV